MKVDLCAATFFVTLFHAPVSVKADGDGCTGQQEASGPGGRCGEQPSHAGDGHAPLPGERGNEGAVCPGTPC